MVCGEVTHEDEDCRVALLDEVAVVGNHIYHAAVTRVLLGCGGWRYNVGVCNIVVFTGSDAEDTDNEHDKEYRE